MREIKFRAWDIINKHMLQWGDIFDLPAWEIFPGTPEQRAFNVMQFTGLKDKNGTEIYEGDILFFPRRIVTDCGEKFEGCEEAYMCMGEVTGASVVGNIYENPELTDVSTVGID